MSSKKQGLFGRLRTAISSTLNDAVDSVSDPGQEIALMLDDLATQIKQAEADHKQAVVDRKVMERKVEKLRKDEATWQGRAEQALRVGDEDLARAALNRKSEISDERSHTETAMMEQADLIEDMAQQIKTSKQKLKQLNLKRGSLMAQARQAKAAKRGGGEFGSGSVSKINEIEDKISELEAMNEVHAELSNDRVKETKLEAQFAKLDAASEVDDELEALKAKMRGSRALTDGKK